MSYSTISISVIPGDSALAFASLNRMSLYDTDDVKIWSRNFRISPAEKEDKCLDVDAP